MDVCVDLRTVNSRYFDFRPRLGKELSSLENELKKEVQRRVRRGRVELFVEVTAKAVDQLQLNLALVRNYLSLADRLRSEGVEGEIELRDLLSLPGVCVPREDEVGLQTLSGEVVEAVREAVEQVSKAREAEGRALQRALEKGLRTLVQHLDSVSSQSARIREYYERKLGARVEEVIRRHALELDQTRLVQEVFYYVEKSDITEEITRLRSHVERFAEYMAQPDSEPVGKALDFLCQEMNREINTILSKTAVAEVSRIAIEAKGEIEKMREQVQNVE